MDHHTTTFEAIKPDEYGFVLTSIAEDIWKSIAMVKRAQGCAITLITGAPGSGKTQALVAHCRRDEDAIFITALYGVDRPLDLSATILLQWGPFCNSLGLGQRSQLLASRNRPQRIFFIDEAQHLSDAAIEWLRGLCEEVGCKLVLSGHPELEGRVGRKAHLASRIVRPVMIEKVSDLDAELIGLAHGIRSRPALAFLRTIAGKKGGLRNVANVIEQARLYAGEGEVEGAHVNQALIALRLGSADL